MRYKQIQHNASHNPQLLRKQFEALDKVSAQLLDGEEAYWTLPRTEGQWRLPRDTSGAADSHKLLLLPMRSEYYNPNAYLAVLPQPIVMHQKVASVLEDYAQRLFQHFPKENSMAHREYDVPMMIGRFDAIVDKRGNIEICELDDVCSLWPALPQINPIAASYVSQLEAQMGKHIYTAELFQYADGAFAASPRVRKEYARISFYDDSGTEQTAHIPRTTKLKMAIQQQHGLTWRDSQSNTARGTDYYADELRRFYAHNEDHWRGDINEAWLLNGERFELNDVALSVRAYRDEPGFKAHMDRYGPHSISMAWERDFKWPLVPEKLAALAANLEVAVEFGRQWQILHPNDLLVFKALRGARTEHVAIFSSKGTKRRGVSSAAQIFRKFGNHATEPVIIQPFAEPDTLDMAGVKFIGDGEPSKQYGDQRDMRSLNHIGSLTPAEHMISGQENRFSMIFRSFVVYLPKEKRLVHIGGMWQATDGLIVHGGSHSVSGPLYVDGLNAHPDAARTADIELAEQLVLENSRARVAAAV